MDEQVVPGWTEALGGEGSNPPNPRTSGWALLTHWCEKCKAPCPLPGAESPEALCPACGSRTAEREWTVSSCEWRLKAQFEQWVRKRAQRAVDTEEDPVEADALRSVFMSNFADGHYSWAERKGTRGRERAGKFVLAALTSGEGFAYMLYLLLRRCHPDVTEEMAYQVADANTRGAGLAFRWALKNSQAPAAVGNGAGEKNAAPPPPPGTKALTETEQTQLKGLLERLQRETPPPATAPSH